jgi:thiol-disulfide isomerase/thioredoxin
MTLSILFYSTYCPHCKKIIKIINSLSLKNSIKFVCIDKENVRVKMPSYIKSVPCIIVGETNQLLIGSNILDWIELQKNKTQSHERDDSTISSEQDDGQSPNPFLMTEMGMFSDNYSFIDTDNSAKGNGGESISHNFQFLNSEGSSFNSSSSSASLPGSSKPNMPVMYDRSFDESSVGKIQTKDTSDEMTSLMEKRMSSRNMEIQNAPRRS